MLHTLSSIICLENWTSIFQKNMQHIRPCKYRTPWQTLHYKKKKITKQHISKLSNKLSSSWNHVLTLRLIQKLRNEKHQHIVTP